MKLNIKDNKTKLILFFMITGWLRVLIIIIPGVWIYMNTGEWREGVHPHEVIHTEQTNTEQTTINSTNDNLSTLKIE